MGRSCPSSMIEGLVGGASIVRTGDGVVTVALWWGRGESLELVKVW
jgi:hypothetical protein